MNSVLVSFCNLRDCRKTALLKVNYDSESVEEVELGSRDAIETSTGISIANKNVYVLFASGGVQYLAVLRLDNLRPIFHQALPEIKDGHSILAKQSHLYVVSTGSDEVFRYDLGPTGLSNPVVIWQASNLGTDTHHVNSIVEWKGSLVISAFGPKFGALWTSAFDGYIHDISENRCIRGGIYHPHSLTAKGKRLYYVESHRKLLWCLEGPMLPLDGYSRGVGWLSDDLVCFGKSVGRRFSKSTGMIANPADLAERVGNCGVALTDIRRGKTIKQIDLEWFGPEIYDVLVIEEEQN